MHNNEMLMYSPRKQHYFAVGPTQTKWVCSEDAWLAQANAHRHSESSTQEQGAQEHEQRITPASPKQHAEVVPEAKSQKTGLRAALCLCCTPKKTDPESNKR